MRSERGSVLALVPAGFLVLIILAAIAVDSAVAYLGQQQLHDALAAAANDSVTAGLNNSAFYRGGHVTLEPSLVGTSVCDSILAQNVSGLHQIQVWMAVEGDAVRVVARAKVDAVFGRAIPGFGQRSVQSSAEAVVVNGLAADRSPDGTLSSVPLTPVSCR